MQTTTTTMQNAAPSAPSVARWVDERATKGDRWVILAGVPFRVVRRNLKRRDMGAKSATLLRTLEGVAYRLVPYHQDLRELADLTLAHDAVIDGTTYHVYVAPPDSPAAHALASQPAHAGLGAPVALEGGGRRLAIRRARQFDRKAEVDVAPSDTRTELSVSPTLAGVLGDIAKRRGMTLDDAVDYIVKIGANRYATAKKFERKRKLGRAK